MVIKKLGDYYFHQNKYTSAIDAWEYCLQFDEFDMSLYDRIIMGLEQLNDEKRIAPDHFHDLGATLLLS